MRTREELEQFITLEEPQSPQAASRLSPIERQTLLLQRQLLSAKTEEEQESTIQALGFLPHSDEKCDCAPRELVIVEANRKYPKVVSNYNLIGETLQGKIYECQDCGHRHVSDSPPDLLAAKLEEARVALEFQGRGKGNDVQALPTKEDCPRCPKE